MSSLLAEIERSAEGLPLRERELLAEHLIGSAENEPLTEIEEAWIEEADRRFASWKRGESNALPAAQVLGRIRKDMGW